MKRTILLVCFILVCGVAQAKIVGQTIGKSKTADGFIKVDTKFIDDKNTPDTTDDEQVGAIDHRLWNPLDFQGKSEKEITNMIKADLERKAKGNLMYQYKKNCGVYPLEKLQKETIDAIYSALPEIKITVEKETLDVNFDLDGDNLYEKTWTINPDGTESRVDITPIPITE